MAYTTINKSSDHFNIKLNTGDGTTNKSFTGFGFQPDMIWNKIRSTSYAHWLYDAVRGAGAEKEISPNGTAGMGDNDNQTDGYISSFDSDGFSVTGSSSSAYFNQNNETYVNWYWKANGSGSSNTDGDITSTVSANTTSGFSIVQYTGNGSASNIGHGLGSALKCIIIKKTSATADWLMGHNSLHPTLPWKYGINLNNTDAVHESGSYFADTAPTTSVFRVEANDEVNTSGQTYIAYCFAEKKGFSKFGSYTGNGSNNGAFIYTGFKPAWVIVKRTNTAEGWYIIDNKRTGFNEANYALIAQSNGSEETGTNRINLLSNGFKATTSNTAVNASGDTYIYMSFAEAPLVGTNNVPCTAR